MKNYKNFFLFVFVFFHFSCCNIPAKEYDVVVLGAGTGAVAAAIESARSGANTLYINPLAWHGGMLTAAGVSATDGNHNLHAGMWSEWRSRLREHYGGTDSLFTGWVSNTMFEPHVGEQNWKQMVLQEQRLESLLNTKWENIQKINGQWQIKLFDSDDLIICRILIDGTDLGDVASLAGVSYDIGMESKMNSQEEFAPLKSNQIIQDLTYVAILKDYGTGTDNTIDKPMSYNPAQYNCSCQYQCEDQAIHPCKSMLEYGKLPNNKYLINWPINGNDFYANVINLDDAQRQKIYNEAKLQTLGFVYYIQNELGYKELGLADDEFPTDDKLALMPYHREGRRINGRVRFNLNHILNPFEYRLYKTGIAVGDYPVDHHNKESKSAPEIKFPPVPSFNIPIGALIPNNVENLLVADKAISVSNLANGSTRLQPVIIQVGQAAGLIAAMAVKLNLRVDQVPIRKVQKALLSKQGYIMPYQDVLPSSQQFGAIQRVGATGILKGEGIPYKWANQTLFYPDSLVNTKELLHHLKEFDPLLASVNLQGKTLTREQLKSLIQQICSLLQIEYNDESSPIEEAEVSRAQLAMILDKYVDPFSFHEVDFNGNNLK